ncbi:MAG TPA: hypothetical protein VHC20_03105 [Candidatus Paceibacterota bacterium]|nr:hypothetical protein [Candidatus Paceibacterota bacterium]
MLPDAVTEEDCARGHMVLGPLFTDPIPGTISHEDALRMGLEEWRPSDAAIEEIERIEQHLALSRHFSACMIMD